MEKIKNVITNKNNRDFLIFMHKNPDGDALGAALALKILLEIINKNVMVVSADHYPLKYDFMNGIAEIKKDIQLNADVAVVMEASSIARTGFDQKLLNVKTIINIDHHKINDFYGDINWVESEKSSVSEMIYDIFLYMDIEITKAAAECIYVGILTDTGRFQYSNTSPHLYDIIKNLVSFGVDVNYIYRKVYGRKTKSYINFMHVLLNNLEFFKDGKIAISHIQQSEIDKGNITDDDIDGASEFLRDIEGVELACFIKPKDVGSYKLSLRSKQIVSVCDISKNFGGGGHKFAAGFELEADKVAEVKSKILKMFIEAVLP